MQIRVVSIHPVVTYASPSFVRFPKNPHKIHGPSYTDDDTYDKLGDVVVMTNRSWHGSGPRLHIYWDHFNWTGC
jgi:hypothetical protein